MLRNIHEVVMVPDTLCVGDTEGVTVPLSVADGEKEDVAEGVVVAVSDAVRLTPSEGKVWDAVGV